MTPALGLAAAYRAAAYVVELACGSALTLRVGERSLPLERLLARNGVRDWAFVTACNPRSRRLSMARNAQRLRALRRALRGCAVLLRGEARADDGGWREASLLVAPMTAARARRLGRQFDQHAVVVGRRGRPARLAWCADRLIA